MQGKKHQLHPGRSGQKLRAESTEVQSPALLSNGERIIATLNRQPPFPSLLVSDDPIVKVRRLRFMHVQPLELEEEATCKPIRNVENKVPGGEIALEMVSDEVQTEMALYFCSKKKQQPRVDTTRLCLPYYRVMIAALCLGSQIGADLEQQHLPEGRVRRLLFLGNGAGALSSFCARAFPAWEFDAVEKDAAVSEAGKLYFSSPYQCPAICQNAIDFLQDAVELKRCWNTVLIDINVSGSDDGTLGGRLKEGNASSSKLKAAVPKPSKFIPLLASVVNGPQGGVVIINVLGGSHEEKKKLQNRFRSCFESVRWLTSQEMASSTNNAVLVATAANCFGRTAMIGRESFGESLARWIFTLSKMEGRDASSSLTCGADVVSSQLLLPMTFIETMNERKYCDGSSSWINEVDQGGCHKKRRRQRKRRMYSSEGPNPLLGISCGSEGNNGDGCIVGEETVQEVQKGEGKISERMLVNREKPKGHQTKRRRDNNNKEEEEPLLQSVLLRQQWQQQQLVGALEQCYFFIDDPL